MGFVFYFYLFFVRLEEAVNALKSSLIFTPGPIVFHVFTEDHLKEQFNEKVRGLIWLSFI